MAKRTSGEIKGTITYRDREGDYKVNLRWPDGGRATMFVLGAPGISVDSPRAYDSVFRAAISFADDMVEYRGVANYADYGTNDYIVSRK
jgi:hypothetical protein